jgi:hypothetical protein
MKRELVFDQDKGPGRLRMLWHMVSIGIALATKADSRNTENMRREAAVRGALKDVSVEWLEAKELGVAPDDLLKAERRDHEANPQLEEWTPRTQGGDPLRFLKPGEHVVLLEPKAFERLEALVERGAPVTEPSKTEEAVDLLDFLTAARKVEQD